MLETGRDPDREAVESLIDQIGNQSFPASDPPSWGVISARLGESQKASGRSAGSVRSSTATVVG